MYDHTNLFGEAEISEADTTEKATRIQRRTDPLENDNLPRKAGAAVLTDHTSDVGAGPTMLDILCRYSTATGREPEAEEAELVSRIRVEKLKRDMYQAELNMLELEGKLRAVKKSKRDSDDSS